MKLISLYHICSMACWILSFSNNGFPSTILLLYKFVDTDNFLDGRLCRRRQSLNFVANGCNSNQPVGFGWLLPDRSEHCAVQCCGYGCQGRSEQPRTNERATYRPTNVSSVVARFVSRSVCVCALY